MSFLRSILLVAGVAACISFAVFAGYALSVHHFEPVLIGLGTLGAGAVLLFVYARTAPRAEDAHGATSD